jgi:NADPH2:quinone reductase
MKAIVVKEFGEPEVMKFEDVPTPVAEDSQVLVRVRAAGVNPVDTYIRAGIHAQRPALPYTPGKDAAGIVETIGQNVTRVKPGDRVFTSAAVSGTYAEFALCAEDQVHLLPENVSFEQGAGVFVPYATAFRALFQKAKARAGETVLVHGASGGVGVAALQWAKNAGLKVIGTASSDDGKKLVKEQGADLVFDHSERLSVPSAVADGLSSSGSHLKNNPPATAGGTDSYLEQILSITDGKGVDVILEMLANANLQKDFDVLKMFGRVVVIGNRGSLDFNPRAMMGKDASVFGMSLFNASEEDLEEIYGAIYEGLQTGFLNPIVGRTFPLAEAAEAHHAVIEEKAFGKIVLLV